MVVLDDVVVTDVIVDNADVVVNEDVVVNHNVVQDDGEHEVVRQYLQQQVVRGHIHHPLPQQKGKEAVCSCISTFVSSFLLYL